MRVIIIGGFLGSGKTTILKKLAEYITKQGKKTAVIVNEIGEIGIDGDIMKISGIETKQLTEGCICCTLKYTMEETVYEIADFFGPDVLLIEPTGVALPHQIQDDLLGINIPMVFSPILTIIDAYRFRSEIKQVPEFIAAQLRDADIIAINKIDLVTDNEIKNVRNFLNEINPESEKIETCANRISDMAPLYEMFVSDSDSLKGNVSKIEKKKDKLPENTNSVELSNVSSCAGVYEMKGNATPEKIGLILEDITAEALKSLKNANNLFVGHIKMSVPIDNKLVRISLTGAEETPKAEYIDISENEEIKKTIRAPNQKNAYKLSYMAAVTNIPQKDLENTLKSAVELCLKSSMQSFRKEENKEKADVKVFDIS